MMKIKEVTTYRVQTENDAIALIEDLKAKQNAEGYEVVKNGYDRKQKRQKGEVIDEYWLVTISRVFE